MRFAKSAAEAEEQHAKDKIREWACPGYLQLCQEFFFDHDEIWRVCNVITGHERRRGVLQACKDHAISPLDAADLLAFKGRPR